jgi:glycosyltransferase involved in cell wall biosynthesis
VIPYGVDAALLRKEKKSKPKTFSRMLFVGQYLPRKGSSILEEELPVIARNHPTAEITFVVPHESVAAVASRFGPAFGDRLVIRSWTSRERLMPIYNEHDILLFPSLFEGFGKVFLEGMAAGLCVVGFREVARRFTWDRHAKETENFCWQLRLGIQKESLAS